MGKKKKGLMEQDLSKLDVTKSHPLSPEVMTRQPTINIGTIGHVAHGKSKLVEVISGIKEKNVAINHHEAILKFTQGTIAEGAPVIPISAQYKTNIDIVLGVIVEKIPVPNFDTDSPPIMTVIRSFYVNKPGSEVDEIRGGVVGGSILKGVLKVGQIIEARPGHRESFVRDESGNIIRCTPIYSRIVSMYSEQNELQYAVPGGLVGVGTTMDPALTRGNGLVGQVLGEVGKLPDVFIELEVSYFLMKRLVGVKTKDSEKQGRVSKLVKDEKLKLEPPLMLHPRPLS